MTEISVLREIGSRLQSDFPKKSSELNLEELRLRYTGLIQGCIQRGDEAEEMRWAEEYIAKLRQLYKEAAQRGDQRTMDKIGRFLWDGVPGSFKCVFVSQHKKEGSIEAFCGQIDRERTAQCYAARQEFSRTLDEVRGLAIKLIDVEKQMHDAAMVYRSPLYAINPPAPVAVPLEKQIAAADTAENWQVVFDLKANMSKLSGEERKKLEDYLRFYDEKGKTAIPALMQAALSIKSGLEEDRLRKELRYQEDKARLKEAARKLQTDDVILTESCGTSYTGLYTFNGEMLFGVVYKEGKVVITLYPLDYPTSKVKAEIDSFGFY